MKKVMFNDQYGLTDAVLLGKKTVTRRIMNRQPDINDVPFMERKDYPCQPPYKVGEIVAVAQGYNRFLHPNTGVMEHDYQTTAFASKGWGNKMFVRADLMPHQILILGIRAKRLQDVTDEDCIKEGINIGCEPMRTDRHFYYLDDNGKDTRLCFNTPKEAFAFLIGKISGRGTWEWNPFVWRIEFKLVK